MATLKDSTGPGRQRTLTLTFLAATVALAVAALMVGVSDNPPGIALLYASAVTLMLAVTHRWRSTRKFGLLLLAAVIGFVVMGVLHNFAEVGAERIPQMPSLAFLLSAMGVVMFLAALILCPAAGVVGAFGCLVTMSRSARSGD